MHSAIEQEQDQQQQDISNNTSSMTSLSNLDSKTNLIVNYLPQLLSLEEFKMIFEQLGEIESCKLIRDKTSGQSLCYGFVNYVNIEDAEKTVKQMNGSRIQNKTIKVSFARPSCESIKGANLYVCGIPKNWSVENLNNYFSQCGKIITSRILFNPNGQTKGVGFIRFDQRFEADLAINKLNGELPYENAEEPIVVKFANYPAAITNKMMAALPLAAAAAAAGFYTPTKPQQVINPTPIRSTQNITTAYNALPEYIQHNSGHQINANISANSLVSQNGAPQGTGWCIFVYNISPDTEDNILWQLFGPFGAVQNVKIVRDYQTHKCKGFGFVTMTNYEEAILSINSLNGFTLGNRVLQVSFKTNRSMLQNF
jgi:ELAV like protein 2/3/4